MAAMVGGDDTGSRPAVTPLFSAANAAPTVGRGGKRSDPAYSPTTFFVRKETKKNAARLLFEDIHGGKDLSDLVEQLLAEWVSKNSHA